MKHKYLFLMRTGEFGGAERLQLDYFKFLDFSQCDVTLAVNVDVFSPYLKKDDLPVKIVRPPVHAKTDGFLKKFLRCCKFFHSLKPDCVVFNQFWLRSFTLPELLAASCFARGRVYMIVHDCPPLYPSESGRKFFGLLPKPGLSWRVPRMMQTLSGWLSKCTLAVSEAANDHLVRLHRFPKAKVKVIYHGVDTKKHAASLEARTRFRREFNIPESDVALISTSMLHSAKRLDRLIESFGLLAQKRDDIHLLFVGDGHEAENLKKIAAEFSPEIGRRIHFLGFCEDVVTPLQASDIFVLPSDTEGLPLTCLEAMSCGLISVVTDCGGPVEIITNGWNGFLVEKSREGVFKGLERVLTLSSTECTQIAHNARGSIVEKFDLEKNIQCGLKLFDMNEPLKGLKQSL